MKFWIQLILDLLKIHLADILSSLKKTFRIKNDRYEHIFTAIFKKLTYL